MNLRWCSQTVCQPKSGSEIGVANLYTLNQQEHRPAVVLMCLPHMNYITFNAMRQEGRLSYFLTDH